MNIQIKGSLAYISPLQVNGNFQKHTAIVLIGAGTQYPQYIEIEFTGDKISLLQNTVANSEYNFHVNVRGMAQPWEKEGSYRAFTSLQAWKLEPLTPQPVQAPPAPAPAFGTPAPFAAQPPATPAPATPAAPAFPPSAPAPGNTGGGGFGGFGGFGQ